MAEWTKQTEQELDRLIEKGTKAWAGTPDNWVDELRRGVMNDKCSDIVNLIWESSSHGADKSDIENAFKAGAEIMRQECIKKVYGWCESDNVAARTVDAIRKIEA